MAITLRGISTAVPSTVVAQEEVLDEFGVPPGLSRFAQRVAARNEASAGHATKLFAEVVRAALAASPVSLLTVRA